MVALTAKEHVDLGGKSLAAGDFSAALDHYHSACGIFFMLSLLLS